MQPRPDTWWPDQETLKQMELQHDVSISVPQKNRDNAVLVTVMAMERNVGQSRDVIIGSDRAEGR